MDHISLWQVPTNAYHVNSQQLHLMYPANEIGNFSAGSKRANPLSELLQLG